MDKQNMLEDNFQTLEVINPEQLSTLERYKNFVLKDIRFNNELQDVIDMDKIDSKFSKKIPYEKIPYLLNIVVKGNSMYINIEWGPAGVPCECCKGSGRKE